MALPCENVIFAFEGSHITSAVIKSWGSNQMKIEGAQLNISVHTPSDVDENGQKASVASWQSNWASKFRKNAYISIFYEFYTARMLRIIIVLQPYLIKIQCTVGLSKLIFNFTQFEPHGFTRFEPC